MTPGAGVTAPVAAIPRRPASASSSCCEASAAAGPVARERAEELVRLVVELYGAGLERLLEHRRRRRARSTTTLLRQRSPTTSWSSSLLLVHGLHPYGVEERVEQALDEVRPYLGSHGGDVELLGVTDEGVVRLRAARQLRRLRVVVGHAGARGRGGDRGGRARDRPASTSRSDAKAPARGRHPGRRRCPRGCDAPSSPAGGLDGGRRSSTSWPVRRAAPDAGSPALDVVVLPAAVAALYAYRDACAACGAPLRRCAGLQRRARLRAATRCC